MKKVGYLFFLLLFVAGGFWLGKKGRKSEETFLPVVEQKPFVFVVYGHNHESFCEEALLSIFEQEYDAYRILFLDDASSDATWSRAQDCIVDARQEHRVLLMKNPTYLGSALCLHRALDMVLDREILIPLYAKDRLAHPQVLAHLNEYYQDRSVWGVRFAGRDIPTFSPGEDLHTVYGAILRQIPLAHFVRQGLFTSSLEAFWTATEQLLQKQEKKGTEVGVLRLQGNGEREFSFSSTLSFSPLVAFPEPARVSLQADIVLFSRDHPVELFATLESIQRYVQGVAKTSVVFGGSSDRIVAGYEEVKKAFPRVHFVQEGDFSTIFPQVISHAASPYVLCGTDDFLVKGKIDLIECMQKLEKTQACGWHFQASTAEGASSIPLLFDVQAHFASSFDRREFFLVRKKDLEKVLRREKYRDGASFFAHWSQSVLREKGGQEEALALSFVEPKIAPVSWDSLVQTSTSDELLSRFEEGWKIDLDAMDSTELSPFTSR